MNEHARTTITLAFAPEDIERLDTAMRHGGYATREEAVLSALDALREAVPVDPIDDEHLRRHYREGLASGEPVTVAIPDLVARFKASRHGQG